MVWKIDDIELPIEPTTLDKRIIRNPQTSGTQYDFPSVSDTMLQSFTLKIKGLIWDETKAQQLWELTKDAEAEVIDLQVTDTDHEWISGLYAAGKSTIKRTGPKYDATGSPVYEYDITFIQYAEAGVMSPGEETGLEFDEPGVGAEGWSAVLDDWIFDQWRYFEQLLL